MRLLRQVPLAARVARSLPRSAAFRSVPTLSLGVASASRGQAWRALRPAQDEAVQVVQDRTGEQLAERRHITSIGAIERRQIVAPAREDC